MATNKHKTTDKPIDNSSNTIRTGAITGGILTFIGFTYFIIALNAGWQVEDLQFELPLGLIVGLLIGAPAGSFGALVLRKMWKSKNTGIIGGLLGGLIIPPIIVSILIVLLGGF